jgi:hypothetical protein
MSVHIIAGTPCWRYDSDLSFEKKSKSATATDGRPPAAGFAESGGLFEQPRSNAIAMQAIE